MDKDKLIEYTAKTQIKNNENIINTSYPRDIGTGILGGLQNISIGIAGGLFSIIGLPINGARQEGVKGFFKGCGLGLIGGIIFPVTGILTGGAQIVGGACNTPKAIHSKMEGKVWDNDKKVWYHYSLKKDTEQVENLTEKEFLDSLESRTIWDKEDYKSDTVVDNTYYNVLEIDPSANQQSIKNSYYKLAKKYHPDKSEELSDGQRFREVNEAYQILGNVETRKQYDLMGKEVLSKTDIIDSNQLYTFFFGTDLLYFYTGELTLSAIMSLEKNHPIDIIQFKQQKREVKIANNLVEFISEYMHKDKFQEVEQYYIDKCNALTVTPFSTMIVSLIGCIYLECGQNFLGTISTIINSFTEVKRNITYKYKIASSLINISKKDESNNTNSNTNNFVDIILSIVNNDIENTIKNACFKILNDTDVDINVRRKRAEALVFIGKIFNKELDEVTSKEFLVNKFLH